MNKPICPFCGTDKLKFFARIAGGYRRHYIGQFHCLKCGARSPIVNSCDTGDYITEFGIVTGKRQSIAQCFDTGSIDEEEAAANCYLIAAAPELYECVCDALTDLEMSEGMRAHFEKVLKKARGEE